MLSWAGSDDAIVMTVEIIDRDDKDRVLAKLNLPTYEITELGDHIGREYDVKYPQNPIGIRMVNNVEYMGDVNLQSLDELNEALQYNDIYRTGRQLLTAILRYQGGYPDIKELIEAIRVAGNSEMELLADVKTEKELGKYIVTEYHPEVEESAMYKYINLEEVGRDAVINGAYEIMNIGTLRMNE